MMARDRLDRAATARGRSVTRITPAINDYAALSPRPRDGCAGPETDDAPNAGRHFPAPRLAAPGHG